MKSMKERTPIIISIVSLCLSVACIVLMITGRPPKSEEVPAETGNDNAAIQYVLYVGTNDKDTYAPKYSQEEAKQIVDDICLKHFEGYTLQEATGCWLDENGITTHEYTLVCYIDGTDEATVHAAADELITALNQNTILIETTTLDIEYYSGK